MNIKIKGIEYYHPKSKYSNEYFINHFNEKGIDISGLLEASGRQNRYISDDPNENSLTMAIEASKKVVQASNINLNDIGLVVCVSTTPEFLAPTNAMRIHKILGLTRKAIAYDMNANCSGLVIAMDQVCRMMKSNNSLKYTLVVGVDQLFRHTDPNDSLTHTNFAESACAILLENVNDTSSDFLDSSFFTYNEYSHYVTFPPKGLSTLLDSVEIKDGEDNIIKYDDFNCDDAFASSIDSINEMLSRNNLKKSDIKLYCLSQFAKSNIDNIKDTLDEPESKFPFIGDEFGYTGLTSPFIALKDSIDKNKIQRGDHIILWTVGVGVIASGILLRY